MSVKDVVHQFIKAINEHDVKTIFELMTEDHRFIDSGGQVFEGREEMKQGWLRYLNMVPDYRIHISAVFDSENSAVLIGKASGTYTANGDLKPENRWETPGAWRAVVSGDKVKEWQVYADNEPIREIMRKESAPEENG
jgi:ketosteroid isomerase-like protein